MIRNNFFLNLRQNHLEKQQKIELTKKLTIVVCVIEFLNVFIDQIKLKKKNYSAKKATKRFSF